MKKQNLKSFIIQVLRRGSYKWKPRTEALKRARISRGVYKCNMCEGEFKRKEMHIDHIKPVIDYKGFTTWDDYIDRLFCDVDGFQVLCAPCHDNKTSIENEIRKSRKKPLTKKKKSGKIK